MTVPCGTVSWYSSRTSPCGSPTVVERRLGVGLGLAGDLGHLEGEDAERHRDVDVAALAHLLAGAGVGADDLALGHGVVVRAGHHRDELGVLDRRRPPGPRCGRRRRARARSPRARPGTTTAPRRRRRGAGRAARRAGGARRGGAWRSVPPRPPGPGRSRRSAGRSCRDPGAPRWPGWRRGRRRRPPCRRRPPPCRPGRPRGGRGGGVERVERPAHQRQRGAGVRGPLVGVARGQGRDQLVDLDRQPRHRRRRGGHGRVDVLEGHLDGCLAGEGLGAGDELVEQDADGVDVRARVGAPLGDDLGGEVGDGPQHGAGGGRRRLGHGAWPGRSRRPWPGRPG